ncbi:MAG TPA: ribonuclease HI family protein [Methanomassiliicoccales archaeon]|nr:ribonuclease HI family protein [Methanomassiliicoccales archaeon]
MKVLVYTDGGSRGNPGPSAYGVVLANEEGKVLKQTARFLGEGTNNEAEYRGLIAGLGLALEIGADEVEVVMDSQLVVHHVDGSYRLKAEHLRPLLEEARTLMKRFRSAKVVFRGRENPMTSRADELVNQELDTMAFARSLRKP